MMKNKNYILPLLAICWIVFSWANSYAQQGSLADLISQAREAGIEQSTLTELQNRAKNRGITDQQLMNIISPAVSLAEQNLPSEALLQKALEGLAKGIPTGRIEPVLNRIRTSTEQAQSITDPWIGKTEVQRMINRSEGVEPQKFRSEVLKATARLLRENIQIETAAQILDEISSDDVLSQTNANDIVAAIGILPDLPTTADQPAVSSAFVKRALKGGFGASELQKLPSALNMAQMRGQVPAAAVIEGVARQMSNDIPAKQILQNLFNGNIGGGPPGQNPKGLENLPGRGKGKGNSGNNGSG